MNDALDRTMRGVADRIAVFHLAHIELARVGNKLPRDRVARIGAIDQIGERRRDRHRVARGDLFQCRKPSARSGMWRNIAR